MIGIYLSETGNTKHCVEKLDSVCDNKLLKKSMEENRQIVKCADQRIEQITEQIRRGQYPREGVSAVSHIKGLLGQRLWFYRKTSGYTDKLKISDVCIGCGKCEQHCPQHLPIRQELQNAKKALEGVPYKVVKKILPYIMKY